MATLGCVGWFNNRRLLGPIGSIPPAEAEEKFYAQGDVLDMVARNEALGPIGRFLRKTTLRENGA